MLKNVGNQTVDGAYWLLYSSNYLFFSKRQKLI